VPTLKKHPPVPPAPRWATRHEVAKYLRKSTRTVDNWIAHGWLTAYRMPGDRSIVIDLADVDRAITARGPIVKAAS
jgi:excisionase family DNA binding protein